MPPVLASDRVPAAFCLSKQKPYRRANEKNDRSQNGKNSDDEDGRNDHLRCGQKQNRKRRTDKFRRVIFHGSLLRGVT